MRSPSVATDLRRRHMRRDRENRHVEAGNGGHGVMPLGGWNVLPRGPYMAVRGAKQANGDQKRSTSTTA